MADFLIEITILCLSAIIIVPVFKKLKMGPSIAYIFSGSLIGPYVLNIVKNENSIELASELGVILLLFVIGLSLTPYKIKSLRKSVFLMGPLQVVISSLFLLLLGWCFLEQSPTELMIISLGLSLSSTALGLAYLRSHDLLDEKSSSAPLGVLVFQDFLVVPILFLVGQLSDGVHFNFSLIFVILFFLLTIKYFIFFDRVTKYFLDKDNPEIFTALCLLTVLSLAYVSKVAFNTTSIGALAAGVALARSDYKKQLQESISPFKGLLMGVFFMSVGMKLNYSLFETMLFTVVGGVFALLSVKFLINYILFSKLDPYSDKSTSRNAVLISQSGEFGFIIFGLALHTGILSKEISSVLFLVTGLSMVLSSVLLNQFSNLNLKIKSSL